MIGKLCGFALAGAILAITPAAAQQTHRQAQYVACQFPDGWNAGDARRADAGIPDGVNHQCRVGPHGTVRDRDGAPTN